MIVRRRHPETAARNRADSRRERPRLRLIAIALSSLWLPVSAVAAETVQRGEYESYARAQQVATALRAEGRTISLLREPVTRSGHAVQLTFYQTGDAADWTARNLKRYGFNAWLIPQREAHGFVVQVGIFPDLASAQAAVERLRQLGHANIRLRALQWPGYRYVVQESVDPNRPLPEPVLATGSESSATLASTATTSAAVATTAGSITGMTPTDEPDSFSFGADGGDGEVLAFGAQTNYDALLVQNQHKTPSQRNTGFRFDELRLEYGSLNADEIGGEVKTSHALLARFGYGFQIGDNLDGRVAVRFDGARQGPERSVKFAEWEADEVFLRYRSGEHKFTVGAVAINWGTLDELAPGNVIARQDMTRFVLDDLSRRYRAQALLRYEGWFDRYKLDVVAIPAFEPAALPDADSIWSPYDQRRGLLLGVEPNPLLTALLQFGSVDTEPLEDDDGASGGVRLSHQGLGFDWGVSLQHVRHTTPYFVLNDAVRLALLSGANPATALAAGAPTFAAWHPFTEVASADVTFNWGESTWRAELAYLSDFPVTTPDLRALTMPAVQYGVGVEFFPGDGNTRLSLQAGGLQIDPDEPIADRESVAFLSGELEMLFAAEAWRFRTRFLATEGEGRGDVYVNPELAYIRGEPDEFYLGAHVFTGDDGTAGGYHDEHDMFVLGWRTQF
ncbi:MAG: SPOR domain-containing protein [Permianibacter sp.]